MTRSRGAEGVRGAETTEGEGAVGPAATPLSARDQRHPDRGPRGVLRACESPRWGGSS
jgi:hypothetical protein